MNSGVDSSSENSTEFSAILRIFSGFIKLVEVKYLLSNCTLLVNTRFCSNCITQMDRNLLVLLYVHVVNMK